MAVTIALVSYTFSIPKAGCLIYAAAGGIAVLGAIASIRMFFQPYAQARRAREGLVHCAKCHYDRAGLEPDQPCPECGLVPVVPETPEESAPKGRPVCSRCHGDMTGREERICPSCGAMYGIEYV